MGATAAERPYPYRTDPIPPPEEYIEATTFIEPYTTVSPPPTTCDASTSPPPAPPLRTSAEVAVQVTPKKAVLLREERISGEYNRKGKTKGKGGHTGDNKGANSRGKYTSGEYYGRSMHTDGERRR
ncbi:hypothetical protein EV426DRAFT_720105 [Tirmania nivea]|nr:hypothetical protein EV426DRAFT_720105 [Tirmania nivea]